MKNLFRSALQRKRFLALAGFLLALAGITAGMLALEKWRRAEVDRPVLTLPIDCRPGVDCFIQNLVDTDPGPQFRDYACGVLGYNSDTGVDFRLRNHADRRRGVAVQAAADGIVTRLRDGMTDTGIPPEGEAGLQGRFGGNAVVIEHGHGWETQYSHLAQGTIRVKIGDVVKAGQAIAQVGFSGRTQFPHVELVVRKDGQTVDPFLGPEGFQNCTAGRKSLWASNTATLLAYRPTEVLQSGFMTGPFSEDAARAGTYETTLLTTASPEMTYWVELKGLRSGDIATMQLMSPSGDVLFNATVPIEGNKAAVMLRGTVRPPSGGWLAGTFTGRLQLVRNRLRILDDKRPITLAAP
jgi:hypothetical protein